MDTAMLVFTIISAAACVTAVLYAHIAGLKSKAANKTADRANDLAEEANRIAGQAVLKADDANDLAQHANKIAEDAKAVSERHLTLALDTTEYKWGIQVDTENFPVAIINESPYDAYQVAVRVMAETSVHSNTLHDHVPPLGKVRLDLTELRDQHRCEVLREPAQPYGATTV
jgi:hypothetical protein